MSEIRRLEIANGSVPRLSRAVVHGETVYLSGVVPEDTGGDIAEQMRDCLKQVDRYLGLAGTDRSRILMCEIWLADPADYDALNAVWSAWIDPASPPARACGVVRSARPGCLVELLVTAAL